MDNLSRIKIQFNENKGQFVIYSDKVYRLIGIADDREDYYWVLFDGKEIMLASCVGSYIVLKNKIDHTDYNELIRLAQYNHNDIVYGKDFKKSKENLFGEDKTNKLIEPLYWKIN